MPGQQSIFHNPLTQKPLMDCIALASFAHTHERLQQLSSATGLKTAILRKSQRTQSNNASEYYGQRLEAADDHIAVPIKRRARESECGKALQERGEGYLPFESAQSRA